VEHVVNGGEADGLVGPAIPGDEVDVDGLEGAEAAGGGEAEPIGAAATSELITARAAIEQIVAGPAIKAVVDLLQIPLTAWSNPLSILELAHYPSLLGFVPLSKTGAELLFETISLRYERGSTLITSNLPFDEWTETFGTERLTGALLDRLTHHVSILEMNGDSYRLAQSRARKSPQAE
jgi:hypothetical protein